MKTLFIAVFTVFCTLTSSYAGTSVTNAKALLTFCEDYESQECLNAKPADEGYGVITLKTLSGKKVKYSAYPANPDVSAKLTAAIILHRLDYDKGRIQNPAIYLTVSGYVGLNRIGNTVFNVTATDL